MPWPGAESIANRPRKRVALVVDDEVFRTRLSQALVNRGWEVHCAGDGDAALRIANEASPDLAIVDLRLPGAGGLDIVRDLRKLDETTCIIMLTGYGSIATALSATQLGASHYLSKPADADQILSAYQRIVSEDSATPTAFGSAGGPNTRTRGMGAHSARSLRL